MSSGALLEAMTPLEPELPLSRRLEDLEVFLGDAEPAESVQRTAGRTEPASRRTRLLCTLLGHDMRYAGVQLGRTMEQCERCRFIAPASRSKG